MFDLTDEAATLIQTLIHSTDLRAGSGLRIILEPGLGSLVMSLAAHPAPADTVFTSHEARVFVAPSAATRLDAKTLDAHMTDDSSAFFLRDR